jgi:DNA-binding beta-propeller fold protein YncE
MKVLSRLTVLMVTATAFPALGAEYKQVGKIEVPGGPMKQFDISFVDQATGRYYLADRTNKALDVFDIEGRKFLFRVGGFVGQQKTNDSSGPDGVYVVGNIAWVGDGDSSVKAIDLTAQKVIATVSTGGKNRSDELAYDPDDKTLVAINNADDPPFATLISTEGNPKVVAKIPFPDATDGAEQPVYFAPNKQFYVSIPEIKGVKADGGVAVIDAKSGALVKIIPVTGCHPAGLVQGPGDNLLLGCTAGSKNGGLAPEMVVMSAATGAVVKVIPGIGGADMVTYNPKTGQYFSASSSMADGPQLGVIDAKSNSLTQAIKLPGGSPHSVAVSEKTGEVLLPLGANGGGCNGCVGVFAAQ